MNIDLAMISLELLLLAILKPGIINFPSLNQVILARGREYAEHSNVTGCPTLTAVAFTFKKTIDNGIAVDIFITKYDVSRSELNTKYFKIKTYGYEMNMNICVIRKT